MKKKPAQRARSLKSPPPEILAAAGAPPADGGGLRYNAGKNQLELIPMEWTWGLGMVLTRGAAKYAARNWERGMKWSYPVGCAFRHIIKFCCGERYDKETGCHHLFMAAWNCCALASYDLRKIGENDLGFANLELLELVATEPGPALLEIMAGKAAPAGWSTPKPVTATVKPARRR
jgi:hypothetical protein